MRTRRQDKAVAAAAAVAAEREESSSMTTSQVADSDTKEVKTSPTTVTISKIEGPTAKHVNDVNLVESKPRSKLPTPVQFPLVAVLSLTISALGYSLSWPFTKGVLAAHSRLLGTWVEVGAITTWRLCVSLMSSPPSAPFLQGCAASRLASSFVSVVY
jgi:hypothetical protein